MLSASATHAGGTSRLVARCMNVEAGDSGIDHVDVSGIVDDRHSIPANKS
jgi:hypothetical protein